MTEKILSSVPSASRVLSALEDLVSALDRRVPHVERAGEVRLAREAQLLRQEAVTRIEKLKRAGSDDNLYDHALVEAIMSDDGAACRGIETPEVPGGPPGLAVIG
jgi:hypothetical protein